MTCRPTAPPCAGSRYYVKYTATGQRTTDEPGGFLVERVEGIGPPSEAPKYAECGEGLWGRIAQGARCTPRCPLWYHAECLSNGPTATCECDPDVAKVYDAELAEAARSAGTKYDASESESEPEEVGSRSARSSACGGPRSEVSSVASTQLTLTGGPAGSFFFHKFVAAGYKTREVALHDRGLCFFEMSRATLGQSVEEFGRTTLPRMRERAEQLGTQGLQDSDLYTTREQPRGCVDDGRRTSLARRSRAVVRPRPEGRSVGAVSVCAHRLRRAVGGGGPQADGGGVVGLGRRPRGARVPARKAATVRTQGVLVRAGTVRVLVGCGSRRGGVVGAASH